MYAYKTQDYAFRKQNCVHLTFFFIGKQIYFGSALNRENRIKNR